jgi:hypothetical protein
MIQKNTIIKNITIIIFMFLFYKQGLGLNLFMMCIFLIIGNVILHYRTFNIQKITYTTILLSVSYSAFYFGDMVSTALSIIGIFIYPFFIHDTNQISILSIYKSGSSLLQTNKIISKKILSTNSNKINNYDKIIAYIILPFGCISLFLIIYCIANQTFYRWLLHLIQLIDLYFIVYLIIGIWLAQYLWNYVQDNYYENKYPTKFVNDFFNTEIQIEKLEKLQILKNSGIILFGILNGILILFIIAEFQQIAEIKATFLNTANTSEGILQIFEYILASIIAIISSIVIAISLLFYFFKKELNFIVNNKAIKQLAFVWICLNGIILITAGIKVYLSIDFSGYTIKRIGIYGFIIMAFIGLYFTFIKINKAKTNFYVVRKMVWAVAIFIGITSPINFSSIITRLNYQEIVIHKKPIEIWRLISEIKYNHVELFRYLTLPNLTSNDKQIIESKLFQYQNYSKQTNWQDMHYYDFETSKSIKKFKKKNN